MADEVEKKPIEAPADEPRFASNEINADEADKALAAMGYNPVSRGNTKSWVGLG